MGYASELDELLAARKRGKQQNDGLLYSKNAIGKIEVKRVAVPASRVMKMPDGIVIVRDHDCNVNV